MSIQHRFLRFASFLLIFAIGVVRAVFFPLLRLLFLLLFFLLLFLLGRDFAALKFDEFLHKFRLLFVGQVSDESDFVHAIVVFVVFVIVVAGEHLLISSTLVYDSVHHVVFQHQVVLLHS